MDDPVLLITGASSGIGAACARAAAAAGWRLVLVARTPDALTALAVELGGPDRALALPCDVTGYEQQAAMIAAAQERFGAIDAVLANAGIGSRPGLDRESPEQWRELVLVNVLGAAYTVRAAREALRASRGRLVLTGSLAARHVGSGSVYAATKAAVAALADTTRAELSDDGVRVTLLVPGMVDTPFFARPPRVSLTPEDVARAFLFAISQPPGVEIGEVVIRPLAH